MARNSVSLVAVAAILLSGCGGGGTVGGEASTSASDAGTDAQLAAVSPTDLGTACGAGCGGSSICTVKNADCESGWCLFDKSSSQGSAYCTADCTTAQCPSGYTCEDVPFQLQRACVHDRGPATLGGPRVKGSVTVQGKIGPNGSAPSPFVVTQAIDATPLAAIGPLSSACGNVYLTSGGTASTATAVAVGGIHAYVYACGSANVVLHFQIPYVKGSYPGLAAGFPAAYVGVSIPPQTLMRGYESRRGDD